MYAYALCHLLTLTDPVIDLNIHRVIQFHLEFSKYRPLQAVESGLLTWV